MSVSPSRRLPSIVLASSRAARRDARSAARHRQPGCPSQPPSAVAQVQDEIAANRDTAASIAPGRQVEPHRRPTRSTCPTARLADRTGPRDRRGQQLRLGRGRTRGERRVDARPRRVQRGAGAGLERNRRRSRHGAVRKTELERLDVCPLAVHPRARRQVGRLESLPRHTARIPRRRSPPDRPSVQRPSRGR